MELKEFVSQTLTQVLAGIKDAQPEADKLRADVNPRVIWRDLGQAKGKDIHPLVLAGGEGDIGQATYLIEFDVSLAVISEKDKRGAGKIDVYVVSLGGGLTSKQSSAQTHRVKFVVPVWYPRQPIPGSTPQ